MGKSVRRIEPQRLGKSKVGRIDDRLVSKAARGQTGADTVAHLKTEVLVPGEISRHIFLRLQCPARTAGLAGSGVYPQ